MTVQGMELLWPRFCFEAGFDAALGYRHIPTYFSVEISVRNGEGQLEARHLSV